MPKVPVSHRTGQNDLPLSTSSGSSRSWYNKIVADLRWSALPYSLDVLQLAARRPLSPVVTAPDRVSSQVHFTAPYRLARSCLVMRT